MAIASDTPLSRQSTLSEDVRLEGNIQKAGRRRQLKIWGLRLGILVLWLGSWEFASRYLIDPFIFSSPSRVWERLVQWFTLGTQFGSIWENIGATVLEAVLGFLAGTFVGVVLGILLGRSRYTAEVLAPFIKAANAVPRIVLAALFIVWFGFGLESKVATVFVLVFFAVFFNAFSGAREVDPNVVNNARILGAGKVKILTSIVMPSATTWILSSMHVAFGFALIGAIVGEYAGGQRGIGLLIANSQSSFDSAGIFAGMIIVTVIALFAEWIITQMENKLLKWKPQQSKEQVEGL